MGDIESLSMEVLPVLFAGSLTAHRAHNLMD
jgi:hypothetical protein